MSTKNSDSAPLQNKSGRLLGNVQKFSITSSTVNILSARESYEAYDPMIVELLLIVKRKTLDEDSVFDEGPDEMYFEEQKVPVMFECQDGKAVHLRLHPKVISIVERLMEKSEVDKQTLDALLSQRAKTRSLRGPIKEIIDPPKRRSSREHRAHKKKMTEIKNKLSTYFADSDLWLKDGFPCIVHGFVYKHHDIPEGQHAVMTRRLGQITTSDKFEKNYATFWAHSATHLELLDSTYMPKSLKSVKIVKSKVVRCKGYALMGYTKTPEVYSTWIAWHDTLGLMRFEQKCDRTLKTKHRDWHPCFPMIMFDATLRDSTWFVSEVSYAQYSITDEEGQWPQEAFFIERLVYAGQAGDQKLFHSPDMNVTVYADDIRCIFEDPTAEYAGIIVVTFNRPYGDKRKFVGIAIAPTPTFKGDGDLHELSSNLYHFTQKREVPEEFVA